MNTKPTDLEQVCDDDWSAPLPALKLFPIAAGTKVPLLSGDWRDHATDDQAQIEAWRNAGHNLGCDCEASAITAIDLDGGEIGEATWATLQAEHGEAPATREHTTPRRGRHRIYRGLAPSTVQKLGPKVDSRGRGGYIVWEGVVNERSGEAADHWGKYAIANDLPIAPLPAWIAEALAPLRVKHASSEVELDLLFNVRRAERYLSVRAPAIEGQGGDNHSYQTACAVLGLGVSEETALALMLEHWNDRCEPQWEPDDLAVKVSNAWDYGQDEPSSWALAVDPVKRFAHVAPAETGAVLGEQLFDPWEEMPVPAFPLDTLPPILRAYVEFQSRNIGADPAAVAMAALVACSGAIDHTFSLKMQQHGGWMEHPRLWVLLVGRPSTKKTPIIRGCVKPLRAAEARAAEKHKEAVWAWEIEKLNCAALKSPAPALRYLSGDATSEKVAEILSHQDRGLLVVRDELASWLGAMEKYGGKGAAADRGFWLETYNGGSYSVDRVSRGSTHANNCSVSFLAGIQPARLADLGDLQSDGLLQRFLVVIIGDTSMGEDIPDNGTLPAYDEFVSALLKLKGSPLIMSPEARAVANELRTFLHKVEHTDGLGESFCSFVGKLAGVHGRLMLVLHLSSDPAHGPSTPISESTAGAAARVIREFVLRHARALYATSADKTDIEGARAVYSYVLTSSKERFVTSDFTSGVRALRGLDAWGVFKAVDPVVAGGWLIPENDNAPTKAWNIVSGVREFFRERRATELARKAAVVRAIRSVEEANP